MSDPAKPESAQRAAGLGGIHLNDLLLYLLLIVGFFLGPMKLLGASWFSYLSADGLAALVLVAVFAERAAHRRPLFAASPLSVPILVLAVFCILELANPEAPFIRSVLGLRSWLLYLGFYFVGLYTLRSVQQLERLYVLLLALGVLTAAYGIYQWVVGPQLFATWSDYYGRYARLTWSARSVVVFRAFSTFVTPGAFAADMALLMLVAFGAVASPRIRVRWRLVAAAAFLIMGVGIAASGSRGSLALLALAGVVGLFMIPGIIKKISAVLKAAALVGVAGLLVVLVIGPVIGERFFSLADPHVALWKWFGPLMAGISYAQQHPFGMGLGYTAGVPQFIVNPVLQGLPTTNVDSGYGSAAAELGFVGLIVFAYFAIEVGIQGFRVWKVLPPSRLKDLLLGPALFAATYPLISLIAQPQATLPYAIYFWLLIGMVMKAPALQRAIDANQLLRPQVHSRE